MGLLDTLRGQFGQSQPALSPELKQRLAAWERLGPADHSVKHLLARYVVVDVEAGGSAAGSERPVSIAAIGIEGGLIDPDDVFEVVLQQDRAGGAERILAHGTGALEQRQGVPPAEALLMFLEFVGTSPLVAYNAFLDRSMIERVAMEALGTRPAVTWIDFARVLPELFPAHADGMSGVDSWLELFNIPGSRRRALVLDCYATAQLLQLALRRAAAIGKETPASLIRLEESRRWLRPS